MSELLSPGVFIEEVPSQVQVIQAVSTSNMGIVGFTTQGPTDTATLVTSFEQFTKIFGSLTKNSFLPLSVAAFFKNGGRRAFVVRVVPADAVAASAEIQSTTTDQVIETGDGVVAAFTKTATTSLLKDNSGASPLVPGTVSIRWRSNGSSAATIGTKKRDGTTDLVGDGASTKFEGRLDPANFSGTSSTVFSGTTVTDPGLDCVVSGTGNDVTLTWTIAGPATKTLVFLGTAAGPIVTASNSDGSGVFDRRTGFFSLSTTAAPTATAISASYTKATNTRTITDTVGSYPAGTLNGAALTGPGTIDYSTGAYSFTAAGGSEPGGNQKVLATYKINAWALDPISKGTWGNNLKVQIKGNVDFFNASTATYSKFNVNVLLKNPDTGNYDLKETFEELDFADSTSATYFPDVINDLSDLITVEEPGGNEAPGELAGISRSLIIAGGDETAGNRTISATLLNGPIAPRSVSIAYTDTSGIARTITDDGVSALTGSVDTTVPPTINLTSGDISFKTAVAIKAATLVVVTYRSAAAETTHSEVFADSTKAYSTFYKTGTDGTFNSSNYGRNQVSVVTLQPSFKGVYALDRVDEIMQVVVPDFAGDVTITGDLLDYADGRATQPAGGDRFIILTVPKGSDPQEAVNWFRFSLNRFSNYAALYWPWVNVADPLSNGRNLTMPPMGHIAGIYARTDATKNVGKSPGGTVDGALTFLTSLEYVSTLGERDFVYPNKINPLISSTQTGLAVWGVRTISNQSDWRYINARRLFMFVEKSIFNATHWIVFENNGPALWTRVKAQLNGFLTALFNEGYFGGTDANSSFLVKVDSENNTQATIDLGQLIVDIALKAGTPAEFIRMRFTSLVSQ